MKLLEPGFFDRNKKLIIISVLILLVSAVAGAYYGSVEIGDEKNLISNLLSSKNVTNNDSDDIGLSAISLFTHNLTSDLVTIVGGFFFSIISVLIIIFNGFSIGTLFGMDFTFACPSVLPHGIIEYFASSLSLVIAFKITKIEIAIIKNRSFKSTLEEHKTELKDIFVMLIVTVILLAIAAIIEAHITPLVIKWYFGL